ncbi:hypothetical protein VTL71DRAFT_12636 [Oculimacula yallundae]|uniref:Uncharacterized protein n=1 Tax=Oculimacula yallundae TaxID=86028 RepID=A0ABR4CQC2_9HELO
MKESDTVMLVNSLRKFKLEPLTIISSCVAPAPAPSAANPYPDSRAANHNLRTRRGVGKGRGGEGCVSGGSPRLNANGGGWDRIDEAADSQIHARLSLFFCHISRLTSYWLENELPQESIRSDLTYVHVHPHPGWPNKPNTPGRAVYPHEYSFRSAPIFA